MMTIRLTIWAILLLATPWVGFAQLPQSVAAPVDVQLAVFVNVWKLDRNFDPTSAITLAVLYQAAFRESVTTKDDLVAAIERQKLPITVMAYEVGSQELLRSQLNLLQADVVYVTPLRAVDVGEIGRICAARHLRSITGVAAYVNAGIAVGIGIRRNRPLIIVNLRQSRAEGSSFSSQLLALARIVGPL